MLKYNTLLEEAKKTLPEFKADYDRKCAEGLLDPEDGMHIVFAYVFVPVLIDAIRNRRPDIYRPLLAFAERMAASDDTLVQEVCEFTVLEAIGDEFRDEEIYALLGQKCREGFSAIRKYITGPEA